MNDNFYLTEPYREARRKAEIDLDNYCSCLEPFFKLQDKDRKLGLLFLCFALAIATVTIWIAIYAYS